VRRSEVSFRLTAQDSRNKYRNPTIKTNPNTCACRSPLENDHGSGHFYLAKTRTFLLCVGHEVATRTDPARSGGFNSLAVVVRWWDVCWLVLQRFACGSFFAPLRHPTVGTEVAPCSKVGKQTSGDYEGLLFHDSATHRSAGHPDDEKGPHSGTDRCPKDLRQGFRSNVSSNSRGGCTVRVRVSGTRCGTYVI